MNRNLVMKYSRAGIAAAWLAVMMAPPASAQTTADSQGFTFREVSLSSGYASVKLPPITLGGNVPSGILDADLITIGSAGIDWRRVTPQTRYTFELVGAYTARARYSQLSAPASNLTFAISRAFSPRWLLAAGVANVIVNADQLTAQPTQARRLVDGATSFDDLAGTVALARSPSPDLAHAALFVPISQSLEASEIYGIRNMISSAKADATYMHSVRLATRFRGSYTLGRELSSNRQPRAMLSPDSRTESAGVGIRYDRTERTQWTADLMWSQASGAAVDRVLSAGIGYGWTGRKWFTQNMVGAALRPFALPAGDAGLAAPVSHKPTIIYSGALGYKFHSQTLLVQYTRAPHDEYGNGGRNLTTGFHGNVQSFVGSWLWSAPHGSWSTRSDVTMVRRPGNFSYINAWLATAAVSRQVGSDVRLTGELLFDRHGSRMFEGFHLTREGARIFLTWAPSRRHVDAAASDR